MHLTPARSSWRWPGGFPQVCTCPPGLPLRGDEMTNDAGGSTMNASPTDETIISTWDQIGEDGWAISPMLEFASLGRGMRQIGWKIWQRQGRYANTKREMRGADRAVLADLMRQSVETTGIPATGWARNRLGDYVPRKVNKARPIRRISSTR